MFRFAKSRYDANFAKAKYHAPGGELPPKEGNGHENRIIAFAG